MTEAITTVANAPNNPTPPGPPSTPVQPAARPGSISAADFSRLPQAEQDRFAILRGPDGGQEYVRRDQLEKAATDPAAGNPAAAKPGETSPALVPDQKYLFGDLELTGQQISDLLKHKGETDLRRAAVPADPSQYKIEAKDVVLPPGMDWKFNEADPALAAARTWAHANGLSQDQFGSLIGQYASMEAAKEATFRASMKRELDALGANATMRVTALEVWLNGVVGPEIAKHMRQGMFSAKIVEGLEKIAGKMASGGAAPFSQHGREPHIPDRGPLSSMSDEVYNATSAAERYRLSRLG
jgi:hypothetical protein